MPVVLTVYVISYPGVEMKRETNKDSFVLILSIDCYRFLLAVSLFQVLAFLTNLIFCIMSIFLFLKNLKSIFRVGQIK